MLRFIHQRRKKIALPPGTLVGSNHHIQPDQPLRMTLIDYDQEVISEKQFSHLEESAPYRDKPSTTWIDINGPLDPSLMQKLGQVFGIHPLTQEDILNKGQRPKIEDFGNYLFIVLQKPFIREDGRCVELEQMSILLCNGVVISLHDQTETSIAMVRGRMIQEKGRIKKYGASYLAYVLIDNIVDDYFATMEQCEELVQDLEQDTATHPTEALMKHVHQLKQELIVIRKSVWPLREVVNQLEKLESVLLHKNLKFYLKDLQDHIIQILDLVELFRDMLGGMVETNLSIMSHQMGKVMKTLTMIASLFIPLTLITGIYGMNFDYMPELHWKYGYPAVLVLLASIAAAMVYYFKKQKWL